MSLIPRKPASDEELARRVPAPKPAPKVAPKAVKKTSAKKED